MSVRGKLVLVLVAGGAFRLGQVRAPRRRLSAAGGDGLARGSEPQPAGAVSRGGRSGGTPNARGAGFTPSTREDSQGSPVGDAPGKQAENPMDIPAAGWKQILRRARSEAGVDNVSMLASSLAYSAFLAIFPGLIAAVTLYGLVADPAQVDRQVSSLTGALPADAANLIGGQLRSLASTSSGALGAGLVVSVLAALFSASGGVSTLMTAVNICYDEEETRGTVRLRATALLLTLGAVVFVLVAIGLIAVLPAVLNVVGLGALGTVLVQVGRWVALVGFVLVALVVVYRYAPDRDNPKVQWVGLGSIVATVLWLLGSAAFSFYVGHFGNYSKTYGALAGVVILLLWLFLTAYVILLGAEINSESEAQTAKDTTEGPALPMGDRNAVKADTVAV